MPESAQGLGWFSKTLIEILPAAVYICDMDAVVVAFNARAVQLWGRTPRPGERNERFCGSHKMYRPNGEHLCHHECPMASVLRTGKAACDAEVIVERPDGSRVTVLANITPLIDESGVQVGAVNCFQDLTTHKAAEAERSHWQEELRQEQKLKAMGHLVGSVAHDFNNLLSPILGNLDMLSRREPRDARETRQIEGAMQAVQRAKVLIPRLLSFARRQPLLPKPVDLNALIEDMMGLISNAVGPRIQIVHNEGAELAPANVDATQVQLAVLNLVVNARDAMLQAGTLTITTTSEFIVTPGAAKLGVGRYIRLSIADTGAGMDQETLEQAVEPFFSTKGVGLGTGLGLSMVEGLVSQLGGALTIKSHRGRGTTVDLLFPISTQALESAPMVHTSKPKIKCLGRILLVDDEQLVRAATADMLTDLGYEVVEAESAEAALHLLGSDTNLNAIITHYLMPGLTGLQLADALVGRGLHIPVLILSGYADAEGIAIGHNLLSKPFVQADLASSLGRLLAQSKSLRPRKLTLVHNDTEATVFD